ncbi:hypothetical protein, partial [Kibdelosporangium philippinense]
QYTGTSGKIDNCQVGVFLTLRLSKTSSVPVNALSYGVGLPPVSGLAITTARCSTVLPLNRGLQGRRRPLTAGVSRQDDRPCCCD